MNRQYKKQGLTLIETMLSISLLSTGVLTGGYIIKGQLENETAQRHANFALTLIKLIDRRIEIDGYDYTQWLSLSNPTNTNDLINFSKKAFVSKNNLECGLSDGWSPLLDEASDIALIPCNFGDTSYKMYDFQLQKGQNNEGFLENIDVIMKLNSSISMEEEGTLLKHKNVLNMMRSGAPSLERGVFHASFANFNDLTDDSLSTGECGALGNNCVIKTSWRSDGFAESLKIDGKNNMIGDNVKFALDYRSDNIKCDMWEYDDADGYTFSGNVDCGVGLYSKTRKPLVATIDTVVKEVNVIQPIILKENCLFYKKDANGFLVSDGTTECGLFTGDNGSKNVVQIVGEMQVGVGLSASDYSSTVTVDELVTKEINATYLEVKNSLDAKTGSIIDLDILIAENGAPAVFKKKVQTDTLNVLTKTLISGDVVHIQDNTSLAGDALRVINNHDVTLNTTGNKVSGELNVAETSAGNMKLKTNASIASASGCSYLDEGSSIFNGQDVLTCRETQISGVYRWASGQFGEIGMFESTCPSGWTDFSDGDSRTLMNSGWFIDKSGKKIKYDVGSKGGEAKVKLDLSQLPAHTHGFRDAYFSEAWGDLGPRGIAGKKGGQDNDNNLYTRNINSDSRGGTVAHENRMPYKVVKICQYQQGDGLTESDSEPSFDPNNYWYPYPPEVTDWLVVGAPYNCTAYNYENIDGEEYWSTYCDQDYEKFEKEREINYATGTIRYTGIVNTFERTEQASVVWERGPNINDPWYTVSSPYNCSIFPVSVSPVGSNHKIVLSCEIDKERWYQQTIVQYDSLDNVINSQNWDVKQLEEETFTENFEHIVSDSSLSKTCDGWHQVGATTWTPDVSTVNYGHSFKQTRTVSYDRTCRHYTSLEGNSYLVKTTSESKSEGESRNATGTKNYITHTGYGSWTGWSNNGGVYSCSSYSPATSTVASGTVFTQKRTCRQNQIRNRTLYNYWANGAVTYNSTAYGYQTINVTQSRNATGTKPVVGGWKKVYQDYGSTKYGCTGSYLSGTCSPIGSTRWIWVSAGQASGVPVCQEARFECVK